MASEFHNLLVENLPRMRAYALMLTRNPAQAIGLKDRGEIASGLRADFIRVKEAGGMPVVRGSWSRGERAF